MKSKDETDLNLVHGVLERKKICCHYDVCIQNFGYLDGSNSLKKNWIGEINGKMAFKKYGSQIAQNTCVIPRKVVVKF